MIYDWNSGELGPARVTVDGVDVPRVFFADTDAGLVRAYGSDSSGGYAVDPATGDDIVEEHRGAVVVELQGNCTRCGKTIDLRTAVQRFSPSRFGGGLNRPFCADCAANEQAINDAFRGRQ